MNQIQNARKFLLTLTILFFAFGTVGCGGGGGLAGSTLSPAPVPADAPNRALISSQFVLANYSNIPGVSSTFTWSITSGTKPSISHWTLGFDGACGDPVVLFSSEPVVWTESDPTTGTRGIKFDIGYEDGQTRMITLTLQGDWSAGPVGISIKSGREVEYVQIDGPVCGVVAPVFYNLSGIFFFDANGNGVQDADEPGIPGQPISLAGAVAPQFSISSLPGTVITGANGGYSFQLLPGTYTVSFPSIPGLLFSTPSSHDVVIVDADVTDKDGGVVIDYTYLSGKSANGFTIGYWKNNLEKAIAGSTRGIQVSSATLQGYISLLSGFLLEPLNVSTMQGAVAIINARGSDPSLLLAKQLIASELNYASGAFIGGDELITRLFLLEGEFMLKHAGSFSAAQLIAAKDRYDAYNNSHGGPVLLP